MAGTEVAKAYVQIVPSARGISGSISNVLSGEADRAGTQAGESIGSKLAGAVKGALAAAGIQQALSAALTEGAALQQSLGGVETLFGQSADTVIAAAENAYRTAGMSANEYMETVTGFSASLLQGLAGDTEAAAAVADMALTDMADNSNKMGTSMELIQNAYQGFAKQNYTMLDNLKLGYGGTKTEMERLLADAQKLTGVKYNIDNLADVYSAIHAVQEEMGITGTTAKEAATTLSGSMAAMKSAFSNVLAQITLGGDLTGALSALVDTAVTFLGQNLLPALWNIVSALPGALSTLLQAILPGSLSGLAASLVTQLDGFLHGQLPALLVSGMRMILGLAEGFLQGLPQMFATVSSLVSAALDTLLSAIPMLMQAGVTLVGNLAAGFAANLPSVLTAAAGMLANVLATIAGHLPAMLQKGIELIGQLAAGLIAAIPDAVAAIPQILTSVKDTFLQFDWLGLGGDILRGIAAGMTSAVGAIVDAAKEAALAALDAAKSFLGIASPSRVMRDQVGRWIPAGIADGIRAGGSSVTRAMEELTGQTTAPVRAAVRLSAGSIGSPAALGRATWQLNQTIYTHDSLTPAEMTREAEDMLARAAWALP